ncbi:putative reverse transcriptase domain-containing protein [Tanacetum coccineum]
MEDHTSDWLRTFPISGLGQNLNAVFSLFKSFVAGEIYGDYFVLSAMLGSFMDIMLCGYLDMDFPIFFTLPLANLEPDAEDPRSRFAGVFPPNIARPLHGIKLHGGPASVVFDFCSELVMKRVAKTIELMDAIARINDPQCDVLNYAFLASRLESAGLQTKLLRHTGIVASGPIFDDALCVFNTSMEIDLLSNPSEIVAPKLMKKMADIYFTRVTKMAESTFLLSSRQMALWKSQRDDHTSDWLRTVPISGLGQTMNGKTYRCVLCYWLGIPLFSVAKPCSNCSRVFSNDIYGDHVVSCADIIVGKEVDIGLDEGCDKPLRPADMLLYSWDEGLDVCVDLTGSSPLTQTGMADFVPGRAVIDVAQRGCGYLAEADPEVLLGSGHWARVAVHIFNRISFTIAKEVEAQTVSRLPSNLLHPFYQSTNRICGQGIKPVKKWIGVFSSQFVRMEDSGFSFQWPVNSIDDQLSSIVAVGENMCRVNADVPLFEYYEPVIEPSPRATYHRPGSGNQNYYSFTEACHGDSSGAKVAPTSNSSRISPYQDHILAERKRREKLSQSFIALSALLPNLKKLDKVSVLGDAIEYMKTLQEKVKKLEEQTPETNRKSVIFEMVTDDVDNSSSDEKLSCLSDQLPEIEARFSGKDVLIRVYCVKKLGAVEKTLAEIEKLHLSVINSTAIIFANSALHITVIAQMDKDLSMTMKDLVKNLCFGLKQFM